MIGETLGSYRIVKVLGEGGMGVVYLAEHTKIGRKAAIKVLLTELSGNSELTKRFFNEARSAAMIEHPSLVEIFDYGHHTNGSAFIVMEFLQGESLGARLRRERLPVPLVLGLARQLALALAAAHAKGIVHRDLKPDNVFLVPDPEVALGVRVKLLDFGIAKLASEATEGTLRTRTGMVMGTPAYMAPEQCRGAGEVDHRADIYSLGCMMFEMACGRPPFVREGFGAILGAQMYEQPPAPRSIVATVPEELERIIVRALEKDPAKRQQSMTELAGELERAGAKPTARAAIPETLFAPPAPPAIEPTERRSVEPIAPPSTLRGAAGEKVTAAGPPGTGRTLLVLGAVVLVGIVGAVVVRNSLRHQEPVAMLDAAQPAPEPQKEPAAPPPPTPEPAPAPAPAAQPPSAPPGLTRTVVHDESMPAQLVGTHEYSLHWITEETAGRATIEERDGGLYIKGEQRNKNGFSTIEGLLADVDADTLTLDGKIVTWAQSIYQKTQRPCTRKGPLHFSRKGHKRYWRLREMLNPCEGEFVDYVDLFVAKTR